MTKERKVYIYISFIISGCVESQVHTIWQGSGVWLPKSTSALSQHNLIGKSFLFAYNNQPNVLAVY